MAAACAPTVPHGPWVYEGTSGGFRGTGTYYSASGRDHTGPGVSFDGAIRWGHVPEDSTREAWSAGVQTSLFSLFLAPTAEDPSALASLVAFDLYRTTGLIPDHASAIGVSASAWHVMPYVQFGNEDPAEDGWYMTQAVLFTPGPFRSQSGNDAIYWLPTFTKVDADSRGRPRATQLSVGAGLGRSEGETVFIMTVGMGMEFFRSGARMR